MKKALKVPEYHPSNKDLVRFVEGKSYVESTMESHVKTCVRCARMVKLVCGEEKKQLQVKLDIATGAVLDRFAPKFQRLSRLGIITTAAIRHDRQAKLGERLRGIETRAVAKDMATRLQ